MKLSDIKGERTFDVIANLIDPIANIASDEVASAMFKREKCPKGMTPREFTMGRIKKSLPTLMREHKHDLACIFATLKGVDESEYMESLNLAVLITDVAELVSDEDFLAFLS